MTITLPLIALSVASLLAGTAIVLSFINRCPATIISFLAMIIATSGGLITFTTPQLCFWGAAAAIATAIQYLAPAQTSTALRAYTIGGALAGAVVGLALGTNASVTLAAAAGAFLGHFACIRLNGAKKIQNINTLAAIALPAIVNFSILMLIFAQLLLAK